MNEPTQTEQSADSFLSQGLSSLPLDQVGFQPGTPEPKSTEITLEERGTQDEGDPSIKATETKEKTVEESSASTLDAEPQPQGKTKNRAQDRITELVSKNKELEAKLAAKVESKPTEPEKLPEPPKAQEVPQLIPPPAKPQYDRETLNKLYEKFEDQGDINGMRAVRREMDNLQAYEIKASEWKFENSKAWEQHQANLNHYRNQIFEKWPEMKDEKSPIRQEYTKAMTDFQELQKNPALLDYKLASLADMRVRASKAAALEEQVKQLQQELGTVKKKMQPEKQTEAGKIGSGNDKENPDAMLARGLRDLKIPAYGR